MTLFLLATLANNSGAQTGSHPVEGNPQSAVRVIIYENLQCVDCLVFRRMMDEKLLPKYGERVAFEHREFPLARHAWARPAAAAARYFHDVRPELGVEFRRHIMVRMKEVNPDNLSAKVAAFAREHGVDPDRARAALTDAGYASLVEKDYQEGVARGVSKTPTVLVDGEPFIERFTVEEISKALDAALQGVQP